MLPIPPMPLGTPPPPPASSGLSTIIDSDTVSKPATEAASALPTIRSALSSDTATNCTVSRLSDLLCLAILQSTVHSHYCMLTYYLISITNPPDHTTTTLLQRTIRYQTTLPFRPLTPLLTVATISTHLIRTFLTHRTRRYDNTNRDYDDYEPRLRDYEPTLSRLSALPYLAILQPTVRSALSSDTLTDNPTCSMLDVDTTTESLLCYAYRYSSQLSALPTIRSLCSASRYCARLSTLVCLSTLQTTIRFLYVETM
jgi:hypothetical protein